MDRRHPSPDALRSILADLIVLREHDRRYVMAKQNEWITRVEGDQTILVDRREIPPELAMALDAARQKLRASLEEHGAAACSGWTEDLQQSLGKLCVFIKEVSHPHLIDENHRAEYMHQRGWVLERFQEAIETALEPLRRIERAQILLKLKQNSRQPRPAEPATSDQIGNQRQSTDSGQEPEDPRMELALAIWNESRNRKGALQAVNAAMADKLWSTFDSGDALHMALRRYAKGRMKNLNRGRPRKRGEGSQ